MVTPKEVRFVTMQGNVSMNNTAANNENVFFQEMEQASFQETEPQEARSASMELPEKSVTPVNEEVVVSLPVARGEPMEGINNPINKELSPVVDYDMQDLGINQCDHSQAMPKIVTQQELNTTLLNSIQDAPTTPLEAECPSDKQREDYPGGMWSNEIKELLAKAKASVPSTEEAEALVWGAQRPALPTQIRIEGRFGLKMATLMIETCAAPLLYAFQEELESQLKILKMIREIYNLKLEVEIEHKKKKEVISQLQKLHKIVATNLP